MLTCILVVGRSLGLVVKRVDCGQCTLVEVAHLLAGCGCLVEINANRKFKGKGGLYPADFLITEFAKNGFDFVLSSDAHVTDSLGFEFDNTIAHLKELGVTRLVSFDKKGNKVITEI